MFQTELIKYIQSFEASWLTYLMTFITGLGYSEFFFAAFLILTFGIDFRKGFIIIQVLLLTAAVTELLKNTIALPRPYHIDSNVIQPDISPVNNAPFSNRGAGSFFGLLPDHVVEYYRNKPDKISFGLPSGHTSSAVTFWGSLILLFENKIVKYFSILMIILVPFSRLYLGRHFPADILGGYVLGLFILALFYKMFYNGRDRQIYLATDIIKYNKGIQEKIFIFYLIAAPIIFFILLPEYFSKFNGYWFGLNSAFYIISDTDTPTYKKGIRNRITAVLTAAIIFYIIDVFGGLLVNYLDFSNINFGLFLRGSLISFVGILTTLALNRKLKIYS